MFHGSLRRNGPSSKVVVGDMRPNKVETMNNFQQECKKALWHAFHMLDTRNTGEVHVSQLKVITSSVGMKMGFDKAEEVLSKHTELNMNFETYFDIVKAELLDKQELTEDASCLGTRLSDVIKTCWAMCNFKRDHKTHSFTSEHCMILWRLFNFLSDTDKEGDPEIPIKLDAEEAATIIRDFIDNTGQRNKESIVNQFASDNKDVPLTFVDFLNMFEKDYVKDLSSKAISLGLHQLYEKYILNILDKGMIWKRGYSVKSWKERWMVLTPTGLSYFVGPDEKIQKGDIVFDKDCSIETPADRPAHRPNRFVLQTSKKPYEMSAPDVKTKNEWVSGIQQSLSRVGKDPNIQKDLAKERCQARAERRRLAAEEERRRQEESALLLQRQNELDEANKKRLEDEELLRSRLSELEEERKRREEAEAKWLEEEALRKAEQERLRQLEEIKKELERLLAEERQAKKDEEIVRSLQARLLEEEFEKREELEKLKQQQEEMLRAEREQKAVLESDKIEQERQLAEAQARLDQLEQERAAAAEKMQEAADKLHRAEKDRCILEEKVKLWKTPVGLARPIQTRDPQLVTHRGLGAFCPKDFMRKPSDSGNPPVSPNSSSNEDDRNSSNESSDEKVPSETDEQPLSQETEETASITENVDTSNVDNEGIAVNDDSQTDMDKPEIQERSEMLKSSEQDNMNCDNVFTENSEKLQELGNDSVDNNVETKKENNIVDNTKDVFEEREGSSDLSEANNTINEDGKQNDEASSGANSDADENDMVEINSKKNIELDIQTNEPVTS